MLSRPVITATIDTVLFETDQPEIVLARDAVGTTYLCALTGVDARGHHFVAVAVSGSRLTAFRSGNIDLREALVAPELDEHFSGYVAAESKSLTIRFECVEDVPESWLPEAGFVLNPVQHALPDAEIVRDSIAKRAAVIVCQLNPKESMGTTSKIDADRLAKCVSGFQSLVRHAITRPDKKTLKKTFAPAVSPVIQVFAFSPGSFRVHFESEGSSDLFGTSAVGAAMARIDELMELSSLPPDEVLGRLKKHRGHLVGAYHSMMKFIRDGGSPMSYRWADPGMSSAVGHSVTPTAAASMCAVLAVQTELSSVPVEFNGVFTTIQDTEEPYRWVAFDSDDKRRSGLVDEKSTGVLSGAIIKTQQYRLYCDERLVEKPGGKQALTLFLKDKKPI